MIMLTRSSERIFNPMRYTSMYMYIYKIIISFLLAIMKLWKKLNYILQTIKGIDEDG